MKKLITFLFAGVTCMAVMIGLAGIGCENASASQQTAELTGSGKMTMLLASGNNSYNVYTGSGNNTSTGSGNSTWTGTGNNTSGGGTQTGTGNNTSGGGTQTGTGNNTSGSGTQTGTGNNTSGSGTSTATGNNTSGETGTATGNNTQVITPETTAPVLLTVDETEVNTTATAHGVTIRWKANRYVSQYAIFRKSKSKTWTKLSVESFSINWSEVGANEVVILSAFDTTVEPGTTYSYTVRGMDANGKYLTSYDTAGLSLKTRAKQAVVDTKAPELLHAEALENSIVFTWNANEGVDKYVVFRKNGKSGWTKLDTIEGVQFEDQSVERGVEYRYTVRGVNVAGKYITGYDTTGVAAKLEGEQIVIDKKSPVLNEANVSDNGITISWQQNQGVGQYTVFRKAGKSGWSKLATVEGDSYTDSTALPGVTYFYTVRGVDGAGKYVTSYDQTGVSATIPATIEIDKSAPTLLEISGTATEVHLTWSQNTGVNIYTVFRKTPGTKWTAVADVEGNYYMDGNVTSGKEYIYTVRGKNEEGKYITAYDTNGIVITVSTEDASN